MRILERNIRDGYYLEVPQDEREAYVSWLDFGRENQLQGWKYGWTLTFRNHYNMTAEEIGKENLPREDLHYPSFPQQVIKTSRRMVIWGMKNPIQMTWKPTLRWVKICVSDLDAYFTENSSKYFAVLEKGKLGTERYHLHGISDISPYWERGFVRANDYSQNWASYCIKHLLKEPLGFWSNLDHVGRTVYPEAL